MLLVGLGVVLVVSTFLLAFTIYALISAVVGVACIVVGAVILGRRPASPTRGS